MPFCYRRSEFTPRTEFTLRTIFSTGGSFGYRSAKPPTPKSARESAQEREVPPRNGVLGEVLGNLLVLLVPSRDTQDEHFSEHLPKHPTSGRHIPEHSPEHFWGIGGFALL